MYNNILDFTGYIIGRIQSAGLAWVMVIDNNNDSRDVTLRLHVAHNGFLPKNPASYTAIGAHVLVMIDKGAEVINDVRLTPAGHSEFTMERLVIVPDGPSSQHAEMAEITTWWAMNLITFMDIWLDRVISIEG